ncbi:hypothetical protein AAC387_Pa01g2859 [Persea americana]
MMKKHRSCNNQTEAEEEEEGDRQQQQLCNWAELVLPWLSPPDLASISSTCKPLYLISKSITTQRSSDASRSLENHHHPIPFLNTLDTHPYSYFIYTPSSIIGFPSSIPLQQSWGRKPQSPIWGTPSPPILHPKPTDFPSLMVENASGCGCSDCSVEIDGKFQCPCAWLRPGRSGFSEHVGVITECGESCGCGRECGNRTTQRGVAVGLKIVRDSVKGWGLHADQFIRRGEFICEYAGELLTTDEARKRQQKYDELASQGRFSSALLVVREHLPSGKACLRLNIDATRVGNVARFINHSCDGGNLLTVLVRNCGSLLPRLCFFASRDIVEGEELTFSYGDIRLRPMGSPCFCGSSRCFGVLPSEHT